MYPLFCQFVVLFPHLPQIAVNLSLERVEWNFICLVLVLTEKPDWIAEWIVLILLAVKWISNVLTSMSQCFKILHVLLHLEVTMVRFLILRQPLHLFLVRRVMTNLCHFRFYIRATFECFTLFFPFGSHQLLEPFLVLLLCCRWLLWSGLCPILFLHMGEYGLSSAECRLDIHEGRVMTTHHVHDLFLAAHATRIS